MLNFDLKTLDPTIFITFLDLIIFPNAIHIIYLKSMQQNVSKSIKVKSKIHIQISTFTF
jgi:hypothetical protein